MARCETERSYPSLLTPPSSSPVPHRSVSLLQAVIVNRLARRPTPTGCALSPFYGLVERYARAHGLDGRLVAAIMEAESGFNPWALSEKGAMGLMQLLPSTALDLGVTDPWDPVQNVAAGVRYLRALLERYGGDVQRALAAYNMGLDRVDRLESDAWPAETRQFVRRVLRTYDRLYKACPG
ncbi:MAG: lytic transglycosylase domain-containing protein [Acidobacteria bacterium]|nr:lytic transglycosylase domain-containing protein [Acidobacteriota bacterium]MDW7984918.1 lytic transglycosylase domain-containing protein [Acidobacteriota bacterium]